MTMKKITVKLLKFSGDIFKFITFNLSLSGFIAVYKYTVLTLQSDSKESNYKYRIAPPWIWSDLIFGRGEKFSFDIGAHKGYVNKGKEMFPE